VRWCDESHFSWSWSILLVLVLLVLAQLSLAIRLKAQHHKDYFGMFCVEVGTDPVAKQDARDKRTVRF
jgi:hypothetical protein